MKRAAVTNLLSALLLGASATFGVAQSDHEKHHPQASPDPAAAMSASVSAGDSSKSMPGQSVPGGTKAGMGGGAGGGMGGGMGDMMKEMGKPTNKELYPTMMQLPQVPPERRAEVNQLADDRVNEGNELLIIGMENLKAAIQMDDFAAIQEANAQIRQGQRVLESGLAARLTLATNRNPQLAAFRWFRQDMNLTPADAAAPLSGLSLFHYIAMLTLAVFAIVMVWMYFQKMKRANALVDKLAGNPPGNTPPPGGSTPASPPAGSPPASSPLAAPAVSPPAAAKPAAPPAPVQPDPVAVNAEDTPSKPNAWEGTLLVAKIFEETPTVRTLRLTNPAGGKLPFN
ncbi:MAG: oxidoreductase, partial [Rudanella sp.]|nr:oxidoreductase [Rudanella sp.]